MTARGRPGAGGAGGCGGGGPRPLLRGRGPPRDVLVAPYPKLPSGLVLTAWGRIERLSQPDSKRIRTFVTAFRGRYVHGWRGGAKPCTTYK